MSLLSGVTPVNTNPMPNPPSEEPTNLQQVPSQPLQEPVAPAPIPTPTPEPVVAPVPSQEPVAAQEFTPTGNEVFDSAASIVAKAGFDPTKLSDELSNGGITPATRAALEAKLGKEQTAVLVRSVTSELDAVKGKSAAILTSVHNTVGGEGVWNQIVAWTRTPEAGLDEAAATEYNTMLNAGGVQAQLAAAALKEAYMSSPGFRQDNPTIVTPDAAVPGTSIITPISRPQYTELYSKAIREGNAVEVASLDARAKHTMTNLPEQWRVRPLN